MDGRGRPANDVDPIRGANGRRIVAGVVEAAHAPEIGFADGAANVQRPATPKNDWVNVPGAATINSSMSLMLKRSIISSLIVDADRGVSRIDLSNPKMDWTSAPGRLPRLPVTTNSSISASSSSTASSARACADGNTVAVVARTTRRAACWTRLGMRALRARSGMLAHSLRTARTWLICSVQPCSTTPARLGIRARLGYEPFTRAAQRCSQQPKCRHSACSTILASRGVQDDRSPRCKSPRMMGSEGDEFNRSAVSRPHFESPVGKQPLARRARFAIKRLPASRGRSCRKSAKSRASVR